MREVLEAEKFQPFDPFAVDESGAMIERRAGTIVETRETVAAEPILDGLLTALKLTFLFLPGGAAIHLVMIGFGLLSLHGLWSATIVFGSAGALIVSTFMVMLGIGKLSDLRYLRVPTMLCLSGAIFAIIYALAASMIPGDFFGRFIGYTLPFTLLFGYLVKRRTDTVADDPEI